MLFKNLGLMIVIGLFFSACSIKQEVNPVVTNVAEKKVCILENKAVKKGFLVAYKEALEEKKYKVEILDENASINSCKLSSEYTARWSWDIGVYMSFAKIKVYDDGKVVGSAEYDSRRAFSPVRKFINAETKVKELVGELFP
jgi:hypothetical protein